jgi:hypothetical protein
LAPGADIKAIDAASKTVEAVRITRSRSRRRHTLTDPNSAGASRRLFT